MLYCSMLNSSEQHSKGQVNAFCHLDQKKNAFCQGTFDEGILLVSLLTFLPSTESSCSLSLVTSVNYPLTWFQDITSHIYNFFQVKTSGEPAGLSFVRLTCSLLTHIFCIALESELGVLQ